MATIPCPLCGAAIARDAYYCRSCQRNLPDRPATQKGRWYCTHCGTIGNPRQYTRGSFLVEMVLWLMLIVPGLVYTFWRLTTRYRGCPQCATPGMIPVDSPIAQAALAQR